MSDDPPLARPRPPLPCSRCRALAECPAFTTGRTQCGRLVPVALCCDCFALALTDQQAFWAGFPPLLPPNTPRPGESS